MRTDDDTSLTMIWHWRVTILNRSAHHVLRKIIMPHFRRAQTTLDSLFALLLRQCTVRYTSIPKLSQCQRAALPSAGFN